MLYPRHPDPWYWHPFVLLGEQARCFISPCAVLHIGPALNCNCCYVCVVKVSEMSPLDFSLSFTTQKCQWSAANFNGTSQIIFADFAVKWCNFVCGKFEEYFGECFSTEFMLCCCNLDSSLILKGSGLWNSFSWMIWSFMTVSGSSNFNWLLPEEDAWSNWASPDLVM